MATKAVSKVPAYSNSRPGFSGPFLWLGVIVVLIVIGWLAWSFRMNQALAICTTENLQLIPGQQSGAAGTIYQHMAVKNTGQRTCTLSGFPTAFLYGSNGYALGNSAAAQPQPAPTSIVLAAGEVAHTVLGYPQAGNFPAGVCTDAKSVTLKLYPPGSIAPLETSLEVAWCPGFSETAMQLGN